MNRKLIVSISMLLLILLIVLSALGMLLRLPIKKSIPVVSSLTPTPTPSASLTPSPSQSTSTAIPIPIKKSIPVIPPLTPPASLTPITMPNNTPTSISVSPLPPQSTSTPIPPLLSISPAALDHINLQPECQYDTHGGGPYLDCTLTLQNTSTAVNATWIASISNKHYTMKPASGTLAAEKTTVLHFLALPLGCPESSMITVTSNANTLRVPVICTDVIVTPNGRSAASDICTVANKSTYTCTVLLLADPANTTPATWSAAATSTGGAESVIFSPSGGTLPPGSSHQITITITDPQCPVDSVDLAFFVPAKPGVPLDNNLLTWVC